jgi:hypothetical protein
MKQQNISELVKEVMKNKKYQIFPEKFVEKILTGNLNKKDPVKETRKQLHEVFLMYSGLNREGELRDIWEEISKLDVKNILDLGCGNDYEFFSKLNLDYTGVDIICKENIITEDILDSMGEWKDKKYDAILLLNVIPVIEKLENGSGEKLLVRFKKQTKYFVLSFPFYSIGKRKFIGNFWKEYIEKLREKWKIIAEKQGREGIVVIEV